jgi:hypothetical protein
MAKSDLLKEAIADAKAVKETALANAKIALEEAFAPRIQSMLTAKLAEDLDEEELPEEEGMEMDMEAPAPAPEMDMDMDMEAPAPAPAPEMEMDMEVPAPAPEAPVDEAPIEDGMMYAADEDPATEEPSKADMMSEEDLELEAIIRELEEDLNEEDLYEEELTEDENIDEAHCGKGGEHEEPKGDEKDSKEMEESFNIDEIIEEILSEDEVNEDLDEAHCGKGGEHEEPKGDEKDDKKVEEMVEELTEAYDTIGSLRDTINEVNLLNAKLLYTNKLFRNFELSENQKMTVIENFDRAGNTREVKLVFSTLAESFQLPVKKKKIVKESFASKATGTTAPSEPTKKIINEGNELANRWKKLAGLL